MSSTDIGLEDTTPLDPEARARVDSFRLQKGRERIAELEEKLREAGAEIGQMALEWGQDKKRIEEIEGDRVKLQDEIDGINAALTREWSAHAQTRKELEASRKAHEKTLGLVKKLEDALLDRHAHASVRVAAALEVLRAR